MEEEQVSKNTVQIAREEYTKLKEKIIILRKNYRIISLTLNKSLIELKDLEEENKDLHFKIEGLLERNNIVRMLV